MRWGMPYNLRRHLASGMDQRWAMTHQFGEASHEMPGVCVGLSTAWMQVHRAHPQVRSDSRMASMMSFEGMSHALISQNSYHAHMDDRKSSWKSWMSTESVQVDTRKNIDEMYGIERSKRLAARTRSDDKIAKALGKIDGYASLTYYRHDKDGKNLSHEMAVFAGKGEGTITLFDPNLGEFQITREELPQFMREFRANCSAENDQSFEWWLLPVEMKKTIDDTPLANLGEDVGARQAKWDDLWNKRR